MEAQAKSAQAVNIPRGSKFETESAQATLEAQPPLPNISPDSDMNIPIIGGYSESEGVTRNEDCNLEAELRQKSSLDDCNQSLSVELNKKCKENESLKVVNALLMEQIDLHLLLATPLVVLQSHQHVPNITQAKKYDDLLSVHEDVKKLIVKEDFRKKLVNAKDKMMSLEVNNNEWEVWRQTIKKTLASEGMGNIDDPTIEELFDQNERFFTIA
ncbi:hypothetical protein GIB67_016567 [Kingdonia uniflora]|uniref:Uncharacterized protein n=1 Tax=Kingdonia uniflora TaxID=39325 RepID=A0A7J7MYX3_9MAGN|nr:hypothetical protein GIB67_016567 [Kingdonia uniflora]